ncbi:uncharacterized protein LOC144569822 [Carex rostrata]
MTQSGIPPRQILSSLRQKNPKLKAISTTVYNVKAKIRREKLGGRTMIQALFKELGEGGFEFDVLHDEGDTLTHLFFIHPMSITLVKNFSSVFIMDCTYKTNRYKMSLLDIVGVSCFNTSFYAGCAFLKNEKEEDFIWALNMFKKVLPKDTQPSVIMSDRQQAFINAVNVVFPATTHLLCVWHIEKNLMTNCRKYFDNKEEYDIFLSIWNKGLLPLKEKFIGAWTDKCLHLGNCASSRAEGAHAKLKTYLQVSTGDFQQVKDKLCLAIKHEFNDINVKLSSEKIRVLHNCDIQLFKKLISNVSIFVLQELYKQYEKTKNIAINPVCTENFEATMGLPCAHNMMNFINSMLHLDLIHPQWRIDRTLLNTSLINVTNDVDNEIMSLLNEFQFKYQQWPIHKKEAAKELIANFISNSELILEPKVPPNKCMLQRQRKQRALSSIKRDPSKFEFVEASTKHKSHANNQAPQVNEPVNENEDLTMTFENNVTTMLNLNDFPTF